MKDQKSSQFAKMYFNFFTLSYLFPKGRHLLLRSLHGLLQLVGSLHCCLDVVRIHLQEQPRVRMSAEEYIHSNIQYTYAHTLA
jgi:hypothetical protein